MQRFSLEQWANVIEVARPSALLAILCSAALVTGCEEIDAGNDIDPSHEWRGDEEEDEFTKIADAGPNAIPGQYIVLLEPGANAKAAAAAVNAKPKHLFATAVTGFAAELTPGQLTSLAKRKETLYIEPDAIVTIAGTSQCPATAKSACPDRRTQDKDEGLPYGVDRADERDLPLSGTFTYSCTGEGVNVYVLDTGIQTSHPEFDGRAKVSYDAFGGNGQDCHGHGTHVAGIIGGETYGMAKEANLRSVRVLDCNGIGSWSRVIAAMEWIADNAPKPAVANMSLSGPESSAVNQAVNNLARSGVVVTVAAGNSNDDACDYSPASASRAVAVAASNSNDQRASFSNWGSCVDIYAAGTNIRSAWLKGSNRVASGTSMASPHVAGAAALYLQAIDDTKDDDEVADAFRQYIKDTASKGKISGNKGGTTNSLLYFQCAN
jgi:subtilisin family serine protease